MHIITKEMILNKEVETLEQYAEAIALLAKDEPLSLELEKQMYENIKAYGVDEKDCIKVFEDATRSIERMKKSAFDKIIESRFIRSYIKNLEKVCGFKKVSKTRCTKILAEHIVDILYGTSVCMHVNVVNRENVDIVLSLLSDEKHLKHEFDSFIQSVLVPYLQNPEQLIVHTTESRIEYTMDAFALYVMAYFLEDEEAYTKTKAEINTRLQLSDYEVVKKQKEIFDQKNNVIEENIKQLNQEKSAAQKVDVEVEEVDEFEFDYIKDETLYDIYNFHKSKLNKVYNAFFAIDTHDLFGFYVDKTVHALHAMRKKKAEEIDLSNFESIVLATLHDVISAEIENHPEADVVLTAKFYELEFISLLAYYLRSPNTFTLSLQETIFNEYKAIFERNEMCQKEFTYIESVYEQCASKWGFSAIDTYRNKIMMSVLLCIDKKSIEKAILKIMETYSNIQSKSLEMLNKKYSDLYENANIITPYMFDIANMFILNYVYNAVYLCPYCVFASYVESQLLERSYMDINAEEILVYNYIETNDAQGLKSKVKKKVDEMIASFDALCAQIDTLDLFEITQKYRQVHTSQLHALNKDYGMYLQRQDVTTLFKKYRTQLLSQLYCYYIVYRNEDTYNALSTMEKIDIFYNWALMLSMYEEEEKNHALLNVVQDQNVQTYIASLLQKKQTMEDENETLKKHNEDLLKEMKVLQNNVSGNKDINELHKIHYKEVSLLQEQLQKVKQEIATLKENEKELHKLRELFFSQKVETIVEEVNILSLQELLKQYNIVLVGGHSHFLKKMTQKYPSIKVYNNENMPISMILKADYVFFLNQFVSHSTYFNAMHVLEKNEGIPWDFINHTNIEKAEAIIFNALTRNVKQRQVSTK